jgi:hypothetical protein
MIFACRTPHTPATLFSRTDGLDMKVSMRQKQGATRHNRRGAKGDNSASWAPEGLSRTQFRLSCPGSIGPPEGKRMTYRPPNARVFAPRGDADPARMGTG